MRKIEIKEYDVLNAVPGQEPTKESLLAVINITLNQNADKLPKGFASFNLFSRIGAALDAAKETKVLRLEEAEYKFLKGFIEQYIPAGFGAYGRDDCLGRPGGVPFHLHHPHPEKADGGGPADDGRQPGQGRQPDDPGRHGQDKGRALGGGS